MPDETKVDLARRVPLGNSGVMVSRLGIGSSYGVGAEDELAHTGARGLRNRMLQASKT